MKEKYDKIDKKGQRGDAGIRVMFVFNAERAVNFFTPKKMVFSGRSEPKI